MLNKVFHSLTNKYFMNKAYFSLIILLAPSGHSAFTKQSVSTQDMTVAVASSRVNMGLNVCHRENKTGVVAVVDNGGNIVALQRDNNAAPHNTLAAQKKVVTHPETQNLSTLSQLLLLGGGVLVKSGDRVIDAIGMAGMGSC